MTLGSDRGGTWGDAVAVIGHGLPVCRQARFGTATTADQLPKQIGRIGMAPKKPPQLAGDGDTERRDVLTREQQRGGQSAGGFMPHAPARLPGPGRCRQVVSALVALEKRQQGFCEGMPGHG